MRYLESWRTWARKLKTETYALYLACNDSRVPLHAKILVGCIVAYAFSPIDLIPDFIPILGYLDDLILLPLGIKLALHLIPPVVLTECRGRAQEVMERGEPVNRKAAFVIVMIWLFFLLLAIRFFISPGNRH